MRETGSGVGSNLHKGRILWVTLNTINRSFNNFLYSTRSSRIFGLKSDTHTKSELPLMEIENKVKSSRPTKYPLLSISGCMCVSADRSCEGG